jgi:hypothetical protein
MPGLKGMILVAALIWPIVFYLDNWKNSEELSGAIPPNVPIIHTAGKLIWKIEKEGIREVSYVELLTDDGKTYPVRQETYFADTEALARGKLRTRINVDGFLLKNKSLKGGMSFWFTSVMLPDGHFLVTPQQSMADLERERKNYGAIHLSLATMIFLWAITFLNVYRLKTKLSMEAYGR